MNTMKWILSLFFLLGASLSEGANTTKLIDADYVDGVASARNYLKNGNAENPLPKPVTYADSAASRPTDMTGGSPNITVTRTSNSLRKDQAWLISKGAANRQGEGFAWTVVLDPADRGSSLVFSFETLNASGSYAGGSASTDSDLVVQCYDVSNSKLIVPSTINISNTSTTDSFRYVATVPTLPSTATLRCGAHVATTNASGWTYVVDDAMLFKPTAQQIFTMTQNWTTGTCTAGMSTNATTGCKYQLNGSMLTVHQWINFTGATNNANGLGIPAGFNIAPSGTIGGANSGIFIAGAWYGDDASTQDYNGQVRCYVNGTSCFMGNSSGTGVISNSSPWSMGNNDSISIFYTVPVTQSAANVAIAPDQTNVPWTTFTPTTTSGFGSFSNDSCKWKRQGEDMIIRCYVTAGSPAAAEGRFTLPNGRTSRSDLPTLSFAGYMIVSAGANPNLNCHWLIEPSKTYMVMGCSQTTQNQINKINVTDYIGSSFNMSFEVRIPIEGWTETMNAPLLTNSVVTDTQAVTQVLWATVNTSCTSSPCTITAKSGANLTSITRQGTGQYRVLYTGFSSTPACFVFTANHTAQIGAFASTTQFDFSNQNNISGTQTLADSGFSVFCLGPR